MRQRDKPTDPDAAEIARLLDSITLAGHRPEEIFNDWLEMIAAALERAPAHLKSLRETGQIADDLPAVQDLWSRMRARYPRWAFDKFNQALAALIAAATDGDYRDVLGLIYMAWGWPNNAMGQYFTSGEICKMMARMVMGDIEDELKARVLAAAQHSPVAQAALLTGLAIDDPDEAMQWLLDRVIPACAPYLEPITVLDCCCGSGAMFLGFAAHCPRWALNLGLIQFYGQDIDMTCVLMAKINLMIHNLNGYGIKCALALSEAELAQLPAPVTEIYREAQHVKDDPAQLAVLAMQARAVNGQFALFPDDLLADQPPPARHTTAKADKQRASRGGTNGARLLRSAQPSMLEVCDVQCVED
jgi:hypothetical protein